MHGLNLFKKEFFNISKATQLVNIHIHVFRIFFLGAKLEFTVNKIVVLCHSRVYNL